MKATGIVRRIDDLGRIVIPIEIRRDMNIRDGDPLEIFVDKNGEVILKKYSALGEMHLFAQSIVTSVHEATDRLVIMTDRDQVVSVAGGNERTYMGRRVGQPVLRAMENRELLTVHATADGDDPVLDGVPLYGAVIAPVIVGGDPVGTIVVVATEPGLSVGPMELKQAQAAAGFIARHMQE